MSPNKPLTNTLTQVAKYSFLLFKRLKTFTNGFVFLPNTNFARNEKPSPVSLALAAVSPPSTFSEGAGLRQ
jgi:hypothetical protein